MFIPEGLEISAPKARHDRQGHLPGWPVGTTTYKVVLRYEGRTMRLDYHQGPAIKEPPTIDGVLDCLASDAATYENATDVYDFAAELGMEPSRETEKLFGRIGTQTAELRELLGKAYPAVVWGESDGA